MRALPASMEFSTSSFTTEAGLSTTSPAAILFTSWSGSRLILDLFISPERGGLRVAVWPLRPSGLCPSCSKVEELASRSGLFALRAHRGPMCPSCSSLRRCSLLARFQPALPVGEEVEGRQG